MQALGHMGFRKPGRTHDRRPFAGLPSVKGVQAQVQQLVTLLPYVG